MRNSSASSSSYMLVLAVRCWQGSPKRVSTRSPGAVTALMPGMTIREPLKIILSPARTLSTMSLRMMTSIVRGRLPAGTCGKMTAQRGSTGTFQGDESGKRRRAASSQM